MTRGRDRLLPAQIAASVWTFLGASVYLVERARGHEPVLGTLWGAATVVFIGVLASWVGKR